MNPNMY